MNKKKTFINTSKNFGTDAEASATINTPTVDRDNDRVFPRGAEIENFKKNPVVLFAHDHFQIPIGSATAITVSDTEIRARWRWLEGDELAGRVKNAWNQDVLRAVSIGFSPIEFKPNSVGGFDFLRWELNEFSIVPIPSNPEAVRMTKSLTDDLQRRHGGRRGDEVLFRLVDDEPILRVDGKNFTRKDLRALAKDVVGDRLKSIREPTLDEKLRATIGVSKSELAAIIKSSTQELVTQLTGRVY